MRRLTDILGSNRSAAILIAVVAFQILLTAVIPQEEFGVGRFVGTGGLLETSGPVIRSLQLDRIYHSYAFRTSLVVLVLSLVAANTRRLRRLAGLRSGRARLRAAGSVLFHFSLLLVAAGVFLNSAGQFDGVFGLTEGQVVRDIPPSYLRLKSGFLHEDRFDRFQLTLEDLEAGDNGVAHLQVVDPSVGLPARGTARVNHPLRWGGLEFHLGEAVGYSPEILLRDADGREILRTFVRVHNAQVGADSVSHLDYVPLEGRDDRLRIRVRPGTAADEPVFDLALEADGAIQAEGRVGTAQDLRLDDLQVSVPRWRRWCYIHVKRNPWLNVVFAGFWLALSGQAASAVARVLPRKGPEDE